MEKPPLTSSPVRSTASSSGMHSSGHHTEDHLSIRGERAMWRAVIVQALMDAACGSKKPEELQSKQEALVWLRGTSRDFITVANHAGFEPEYLRTMVTRALQNNCNWRAMPGHGTRQQVNRTRKTDRKPGQRR